jgi:hypothetical protein
MSTTTKIIWRQVVPVIAAAACIAVAAIAFDVGQLPKTFKAHVTMDNARHLVLAEGDTELKIEMGKIQERMSGLEKTVDGAIDRLDDNQKTQAEMNNKILEALGYIKGQVKTEK